MATRLFIILFILLNCPSLAFAEVTQDQVQSVLNEIIDYAKLSKDITVDLKITQSGSSYPQIESVGNGRYTISISAMRLGKSKSLDEIAGSLGHEVGHVACNHPFEGISRESYKEEIEADLWGVRAMIALGYDPGSWIDFFVEDCVNTNYGLDARSLSHPSANERIRHVRQLIESLYL